MLFRSDRLPAVQRGGAGTGRCAEADRRQPAAGAARLEHGADAPRLEEAAERGTVIQYLLSDAGQRSEWSKIVECLNEGDMLYFSHGFSVTFKDDTGVIPPPHVDVALVAPKGAGRSVRRNFLDGSGINASFAVHQDATGRVTLLLS